MSSGPLYNGKQTAERLKVDPKTLRAWVKKGVCPIEPIPGSKPPRWWARDVEAHCERKG